MHKTFGFPVPSPKYRFKALHSGGEVDSVAGHENFVRYSTVWSASSRELFWDDASGHRIAEPG